MCDGSARRGAAGINGEEEIKEDEKGRVQEERDGGGLGRTCVGERRE